MPELIYKTQETINTNNVYFDDQAIQTSYIYSSIYEKQLIITDLSGTIELFSDASIPLNNYFFQFTSNYPVTLTATNNVTVQSYKLTYESGVSSTTYNPEEVFCSGSIYVNTFEVSTFNTLDTSITFKLYLP